MIPKIFIIHYKPLIQRKQYLLNEFQKYNFKNFEFIESFQRETVDMNELNSFFTNPEKLNHTQKCITAAHIDVYKKIVENNIQNAIIIEDDVIFQNNFDNKLFEYLKCIPEDYDMALINFYSHCRITNPVEGQIWYSSKYTKTVCGYIITKSCCEKILGTLPFKEQIDWELNNTISTQNLKCYWCHPELLIHGSDYYYNVSYSK